MPIAHQGESQILSNAIRTIVNRENDYKEGIQVNHALSKTVAQRLALEGEVEQTMLMMISGNDSILPKDEIMEFLSEQRCRLKELAEQNVLRERKIDVFVQALRQLDGAEDYKEGQMEGLMKECEEKNSDGYLDLAQEAYCRDMREKLGEQDDQPKEDDEIQIDTNKTTQNFKCPITTMWMDDAIKNKACGHVYSREGIMAHIKHSRGSHCCCPVPGCTNQHVTKSQLADDIETSMMVRREKVRHEKEEAHRLQSQEQICMEDEE